MSSDSETLLYSMSKLALAGQTVMIIYVCDLRNRANIEEVIVKTVDECPSVDILVNNAGYTLGATAPFWEQDLDNVESVMDVNLRGLMAITHYVLKLRMTKRSPHACGTVVAVEGFTNVLRHETLGTNIRVLVIRPGTVQTEFHSRRLGYDQDKTAAMFEGMGALLPEDIAASVLWQCMQPERVSVVTMETLPTAQRSLYAADRSWEDRNGPVRR
ncbi:hypothetical protein Rhopal_001014-T1 [Rhodotorula paludigena]|uniref:Uncharacterized protein n=1 Tax=Rhodotorula paludigena TaxID=86838 RepID=A0AAV5GHH1_9BASI|nr:hypothetical protein Rhopal_001014-T1 [Rhodotorula paludigena]